MGSVQQQPRPPLVASLLTLVLLFSQTSIPANALSSEEVTHLSSTTPLRTSDFEGQLSATAAGDSIHFLTPDLEPAASATKTPEGVQIASATQEGQAIGFSIPKAGKPQADSTGKNVVLRGNDDDTSFMVSSQHGVTSIRQILESPSSSPRITYDAVGIDHIEINDDGGASLYTESDDGSYTTVGYVAEPWAYDANGVSVDTWFETDGRSLTQVVDHTSKSYAYPIMADPSWSEIWDKMKSVGKTAWSGVKWVAGKGKVLARRVGPGAPVLCAVGGAWAWFRSDADGWVRVGDAVSGCIL